MGEMSGLNHLGDETDMGGKRVLSDAIGDLGGFGLFELGVGAGGKRGNLDKYHQKQL